MSIYEITARDGRNLPPSKKRLIVTAPILLVIRLAGRRRNKPVCRIKARAIQRAAKAVVAELKVIGPNDSFVVQVFKHHVLNPLH
jgi:hypothetical protein